MWCVLWGEGESGPWLEASILSRLKFPIAAEVQCTLLPHGGAVALESDSAVAGSVFPGKMPGSRIVILISYFFELIIIGILNNCLIS